MIQKNDPKSRGFYEVREDIDEIEFLDPPTSFMTTISESSMRTRFNYTISPLEPGKENQRIHGGIKTEILLDEEVRWHFSHLISLGELEESQSSKLE